jgi:hypothetical protein
MYYAPYLVLLSQLHHQIHIKIVVEDVEIYIDTGSQDGEWCMQTQIFNGDGEIPKNVKECLSSLNLFRLQTHGPYLQLVQEKESVNLVFNCIPMVSFKQFRETIKQFLEFYGLWKEFLVSA